MPFPHEQGPCGALPHTSWNFSILWCPHRQQFTVTHHSYREHGTKDDPEQFFSARQELGPFDSKADAAAVLSGWLGEHFLFAEGDPPCLPG